MKLIDIIISKNKNKKYTAIFSIDEKIKKISFGAKGYEDYTTHKNKKRRHNYRQRHSKDKINSPMTAGSLSWYILWGDSTSMNKNIKLFKSKFNV